MRHQNTLKTEQQSGTTNNNDSKKKKEEKRRRRGQSVKYFFGLKHQHVVDILLSQIQTTFADISCKTCGIEILEHYIKLLLHAA